MKRLAFFTTSSFIIKKTVKSFSIQHIIPFNFLEFYYANRFGDSFLNKKLKMQKKKHKLNVAHKKYMQIKIDIR